MKYQIRRRSERGGQFRWTLIASNGKKIANSGESYHNMDDCLAGIRLTASSAGATLEMPDGTVGEVFPPAPPEKVSENAKKD